MVEEFIDWDFYTDDQHSIEFSKSLMNDWVDRIVKEHKKAGSSKIKVHVRYEIFKAPTDNNCESPMMIEYDREKTELFDWRDQNHFTSNKHKSKTLNIAKFEQNSNLYQQTPKKEDQGQMFDETLSILETPENAGTGFLDQESDYLAENTRKNEYGEPGEPSTMFQPQPKEDSPASRKDLHINLKKPFSIVHCHLKGEKKDEVLLESKVQLNRKRTNSKIYNGSLPKFIDLSKVDPENIKDLGGDPSQLIMPLKVEKHGDNCYKIGFEGKTFCYVKREDSLFYSDKNDFNDCKQKPESFLMTAFENLHCKLEKICAKIINSKGAVDELCSLLKNLKGYEKNSDIYFEIFDHFSKKNMKNSYPKLHECLSNHSNNQYVTYSVSIFLAWKKSGLPLKFKLTDQDIRDCFYRAAWEITLAKVTYTYHCDRFRKRKNLTPPPDSLHTKDVLTSSKKTRVTNKKNLSSAQEKPS